MTKLTLLLLMTTPQFLTDTDRLAYLLRKEGFTFDSDGALNKPKDCTSYHQNLLLSIFVTGGLNLVNGRYYIPETISAVQPTRQLEDAYAVAA